MMIQIRNVARVWTYETSICCEESLATELPYTEYFEYFGPDFSLHPEVSPRQDNANSRQYLDNIMETVHRQLKMVACAPSVQMQDVPPTDAVKDENSEQDPNVRRHQLMDDLRVDHNGEFYDDDSDQDQDEVT